MTITTISEFDMPPFYTMEIMSYAKKLESSGKFVYHLEVGQSVNPTPKAVLEEAIKALREKDLSYCSALGLLELRTAIAKHYQYAYGLDIDPDCIVITPGSSLGLYISLLMGFKKRARIAIASPSYPCYRNVIRSLGLTLIEINTSCENDYLLTIDELDKYDDVHGILIASPNNPTGSMYDEASLKKLSMYCQKKGIKIIADELYHGITFDNKAESILKFNKAATVINGFSKYFSMTGWRVAWMVVPPQDVRQYESLLQNMILCTSTLTQIAAVKAFSYYELDRNVKAYKNNRDILYEALTSAGLDNVYNPAGGFYIYLKLNKVRQGSLDFCKKLLYEEGIAVSPGIDFSSSNKDCAIRLSFSQKQKIIEHAAIKLNKFIKKL